MVTTSPISPGASSGLSGWGDGEISNVHATQGLDMIRPTATLAGLSVSDILVDNCRELLTPNTFAVSFPALRMSRVEGHAKKRGLFVRAQSPDIALVDVYMKMFGPANTSSGDNPAGFQFGAKQDADAPDDVVTGTLLRCRAEGFQQELGVNDYWNGDGFLWEGGAGPWDCDLLSAINNTDGGFDIKCKQVLLRRAFSQGNGRNFKIWADFLCHHAISVDPVTRGGDGAPTAHLMAQGPTLAGNEPPVIRFNKFEMYNSGFAKTISCTKGPCTVIIDWSNLSRTQILAAAEAPNNLLTLVTNY